MRSAALFAIVALAPSLAFGQPCTTDGRRVVDAIYQQMLGHSAGADGITIARQLAAGDTAVKDIVREVALSEEHQRRFLRGDRTAAVTNLYLHILGRQPDQDGLRAHVDALRTQPIANVIESLIESPEYQNMFGYDTVPGSRVVFCGGGASSSSQGIRFRGMDRNRNGAIEREEWNGSPQSFNVHDWNRDGVLSGDEVRSGSWRSSRDPAEDDFDPFAPTAWTTTDFTQLDRNRDNRVSAGEWYWDAETFRRADRDRNGFLSMAEFTSAGDDDRFDSFDNLDVNRNGRVERGEWHGSWETFQWLDRNNDNLLSRAEVVGETSSQFDNFASIDTDGNRSITPNEWRWSRRSFDLFDTNHDGVVSRQEFAAGTSGPRAIPR